MLRKENYMVEYEERLKQREAELELAIYFAKEFINEFGRQRALEIIEKAWTKYGINRMKQRLRGAPSEDRLKKLGEWFKEQATNRQELKVVEATPKRVCIEISRCPTYDVCKNQGVPEICQKYCDSDYAVTRTIHPKVKLLRNKEIAYGADCCNHCWIMED
ncbi:L-2-amino-thiazoline-4-carboxylic acid hydrolase [Chloroflexota bacterium]